MEKEIFQKWAKELNLTSLEEEEYILTSEEENRAIGYAIEQAKKHKAWKLSQMGLSEMEILSRLSQIDFTEEIDRGKILLISNSNKHRQIWNETRREEEREFEKKRILDLRKKYTAEYVFKLMQFNSRKEYGKNLIVNDFNKHLITSLCYFLSNDERFETALNYSFAKGILIRGISGLGKTYIIKCLSDNELNRITIFSMIRISEEVKKDGDYLIPGGNLIYLDDVGTEEATVNHYGTKVNWFKDFIEFNYLKNQGKGFSYLMISTNNSFVDIEEKYGFRVRSRMKEMFNIIDISGTDMRA